MKETTTLIVESWATKSNCLHTIDNILAWVHEKNKSIRVNIRKIHLKDSDFWFYDDITGCIRNRTNSFFEIQGLRQSLDCIILREQPIIVQNEIGYLGIICKDINGILHFLMQAKIEPGNINKVQISPTIQATKSNFMQKHGGDKPAYLDYFINSEKYEIIIDQIQSEQSSRFYKKRNRNIIIKVDEDIEVLPSHMWMTLGQIKELLKTDNLVNMDTRTVLSCIPLYQTSDSIEILVRDKSLYRSMFNHQPATLTSLYSYINNYKMFDKVQTYLVPLTSLKSWSMKEGEFSCNDNFYFRVIFCDIEIEGREVKHWVQPLFEAIGQATFGLLTCQENGVRKFLVHATPEVGCFDKIELGPTVQLEPSTNNLEQTDTVIKCFLDKLQSTKEIKYDVLLSEEGGRFYHEENRNVIIEIDKSDIRRLPKGYFWVDYKTLNILVQINNCVNIQLRSLLSLLEV